MVVRKRFFAGLAAVAALSMGLSGCGSTPAADGDADKKTDDGGTTEVVNLTYMHRLPDKEGMTLTEDIVAKWNKEHPEIQVTATKFDGTASEMIKKLETDVNSGEAPDLAQVGYAEVPETFNKGMLMDVTEYAGQYKDHFAETPYNLMSVNGQYFGLPQDTGPLVYMYNAAEFEKLGIEVPKTADDLVAAAKKAAESGKYIMAFQPDEAGNMLTGLASAAESWYKVENDKWVVDTESAGSQAVADVFQQLLDANAATTNARWDASFDASLQDGSLIGTVAAAWEAPLFMDSSGETGKGDWRVTQIGDWFGNGTKTGPDGGSGVAVMKGCEHPKEAMEFLDWFNTQVVDLVSQGLVVAATTEDAKTPETWAEFFGGQDIMAEFKTANDNMADVSYIPGFSAVGAAMNEAAAAAKDGTGKVADIFSTAQKTSVDTLTNYNLPVAE